MTAPTTETQWKGNRPVWSVHFWVPTANYGLCGMCRYKTGKAPSRDAAKSAVADHLRMKHHLSLTAELIVR
jgi:hypothetical protein